MIGSDGRLYGFSYSRNFNYRNRSAEALTASPACCGFFDAYALCLGVELRLLDILSEVSSLGPGMGEYKGICQISG